MKVSRSFAPMSLHIETEEDLKFLCKVISLADDALCGSYRGFFGIKDSQTTHQNLMYLLKQLKGN